MGMNLKIQIFLLASFALYAAAVGQSKSSLYAECIGPTGIFGTCIPLLKCGGLFDILSDSPLKPERLRFLQRSTCTFVKKDPWVCCSPEDEQPSMSTTDKVTMPSQEISMSRVTTTTPEIRLKETPKPTEATTVKLKESTVPPESGGITATKANDPTAAIENHPNFSLLPKTRSCGASFSSERIIGGIDAGLGTFPWMALLSFKDPSGGYQLACGGTLINSQYILTAGHCISKLPPGFSVSHIRLGEYDEQTNPDCVDYICAPKYQEIPVEDLIIHERYDSTGRHDNDIALVRMKKPANLTSPFVTPVCLPYGDILRSHKLQNDHTIVAGWGRTEFNAQDGSPVLQKVNIPVITQKECDDVFASHKMSKIDYKSQFCAGGVRGKDSCKGDSGGPLMENVFDRKTTSGRTWQFGIVSYGPRKCGTTIPAVYTRVSYFMPWILDHLRP